jgi:asparagine synthase (glutamine-hydrolysing)
LRTFSVGFEGPGAVSELPAAREIAEYLDSEHHELVMNADQVASELGEIITGLDIPLADPTAIPTWYMSRFARERVTVALSGEGADEIFGGYARQRYDVALDRIGSAGRRLLPLALRLVGRPPSRRLLRRLRMAPGLARQLDWGRVFSARDIDSLCLGGAGSEAEMLAEYGDLDGRWHRWDGSDPVNGRLETDRSIFLPGDLLPKVDRMSMAHSLEVRVPYLDNEVADLLLPLPGRMKQTLTRDKILLRDAARGLLPPTGALRRKRGFEVPIGEWLRGPLRSALTDLLSEETVARQGLLRPPEVSKLVKQHCRETCDHGRALWALMVFSHWLDRVGQ